MNKASLNYLLEFSVSDSQTRENFLNKLLTRKNAENQKNVKLLKIIYRYVDTENVNGWDSAKVCKELEIKMGELDTLKSRLISDYREFVFGWEKFEKELRENFKGTDLEFDFLKAKKMNTIGMKKEMKTFHLNFLNHLEKNRKEVMKNYNINSSQLFLLEFESTETMAHYYYVQKNYPQFLSFFNKLEKLYKLKNKFSLSEKDEAAINVRLFLTRTYKHVFKLISDKNYLSALNNLNAAYSIIMEYNLEVYRYGIPLLMALIYFRLNDNVKLKKLCGEIALRAENEGRFPEAAVANSYLILLEYNKDKSKLDYYIEKIKEYYEICKVSAPYSAYTFILIKHYAHILSNKGEGGNSDHLMKHALANSVLSHNKSFTFLTYYQIENEKYFSKILRFENYGEPLPIFIHPGNEVLDAFQKTLGNIVVNMRESISVNTLCNIHITFLYIIFMKEGEPDIQYAEFIKGKLHRMIKTRNIAIDENLYKAVTLALQMQEDFSIMKKPGFLNKYSFTLDNLCAKVIESSRNSIYTAAGPYSILYTAAKRINQNEIWQIIKKYDWGVF